jgi:hypothetical protein
MGYEADFLQYLRKRGIISLEDFETVLTMRKDTNVSLGIIAINRGWLSAEQVKQVLALQKKMKIKFGQVALRQQFLDRKQLRALLAEQKRVNLPPEEILVFLGRLTPQQLLDEQRVYARLSGKSSA